MQLGTGVLGLGGLLLWGFADREVNLDWPDLLSGAGYLLPWASTNYGAQ